MQQLSPCYFFAALEKMKNLMQFKGDQYCAFKAIALPMHAFKAIALQSENNIVLLNLK